MIISCEVAKIPETNEPLGVHLAVEDQFAQRHSLPPVNVKSKASKEIESPRWPFCLLKPQNCLPRNLAVDFGNPENAPTRLDVPSLFLLGLWGDEVQQGS